jgi:GAG-pre-integrase domain
MAILWSAPGVSTFRAFINELIANGAENTCFASEINDAIDIIPQQFNDINGDELLKQPLDNNQMDFNLEVMPKISKEKSHEEELMLWHQRLSHMPMKRIQAFATKGLLPGRLAKCKVPLCPACVFGKMTRKKCRAGQKETHSITPEGACLGGMVSVDQLQSDTPGLIGHMKGIPTRKRYSIATIFVEHYSDFTYVYLQESSSSEETLAAKLAFERVASSYGVKIQRYHSDNGTSRFADNAWMQHSARNNQITTMCGVNAHHQNGKENVEYDNCRI